MLLYLTSQTWTRGEASEALGRELMRAMDLNVNVLLVHEMPGMGGQEARFGCSFGSFFSCKDGATPDELLKRGIYSSIAVALKGGLWREASMALLGMALGMSKEENVLGLQAEAAVLKASFKASRSILFRARRPTRGLWRPWERRGLGLTPSTTHLKEGVPALAAPIETVSATSASAADVEIASTMDSTMEEGSPDLSPTTSTAGRDGLARAVGARAVRFEGRPKAAHEYV